MLKPAGSIRYWITGAFLLGAFILLHSVSHGEPVLQHQPLSQLPFKVGNWQGEEQPLSPDVLQATGVSDYNNRFYVASGKPPVEVYVGYYASQKTGDTMHSPKNCLPGAGWEPVSSGYVTVSLAGQAPIVLNEYVIQKDEQKQLVFYWYQGRGRVIASEYAGKFWMVADAISRNRTDGALVRLVTPIRDDEDGARARLMEFTQDIFPQLDRTLPK